MKNVSNEQKLTLIKPHDTTHDEQIRKPIKTVIHARTAVNVVFIVFIVLVNVVAKNSLDFN